MKQQYVVRYQHVAWHKQFFNLNQSLIPGIGWSVMGAMGMSVVRL